MMTCALLACTAWLRADDGKPVAIGDRVAPFEFVDIRGARRGLDDFGAKQAYVLYFTSAQCPLAPRYLPRLRELHGKFAARSVQFIGVDAALGDTLVEMGTQALDCDAGFPFVKDVDLSVAHALGATRAGEVVVLDGERRLRYRGRVDDQYQTGGERAAATRADLALALDELLSSREVRVAETPASGCLLTPEPAPRDDVTYARDVAPILERCCVECHRKGGAAPFELADCADATDHGAMIAEVVAIGRMPPWHASAHYGHFNNANARELRLDERRTLLDWTRTGMKSGDLTLARSAPLPPLPPWKIDEPDLVLMTLGETKLPADGIVPYQYAVLPYVFLSDTWIDAIQIRPKNRRVMHHCNLAWFKLGESFKTENFITGQVPGGDPMVLDPGTAVLLPAGSVLGLQIHYVTTGKEESDRIEVGLHYPRVPVDKRLRHLEIADFHFAIPPGADAHPVAATRTFDVNATGIGLYAHMHKRGRDMRFTSIAPDGARETLLLIPNYDFDWQASYRWFPGQQRFAKGTSVECLAHFDNSPFNPWNPDPKATVRFGLQTEQEMMYGFLFYVDADEQLGLKIDPASGHVVGS